MAGRLAGKRAFVTGAGQGIGRAVALWLAGDESAFTTGTVIDVDGGQTL